jgi:hypothetical protein
MPAARAISAAFIQSWLPTVPPAPNTTLVRRVGLDCDHAEVGTDAGQPFDFVLVVAPELALRQVQQRAARKRDDRVLLGRALRNDRVVRDRADAAGHVGHAHRVLDELAVQQDRLGELAGQIEAAAGLRRRDAFGLVERPGGRRGSGTGEGECEQ